MFCHPRDLGSRWGLDPFRHLCPLLIVLTVSVPALGAGGQDCPSNPLDDPGVAAAWRTLRAVDCARCHGREYEGMVGPSIVDFVRNQSRERFDQIVLQGAPERGMPGYAEVPRVADSIDDIYRYFQERAAGTIGPDDRPSPGTATADAGGQADPDKEASAARC